jgi:hypothetical protein
MLLLVPDPRQEGLPFRRAHLGGPDGDIETGPDLSDRLPYLLGQRLSRR